MRSRTWDRCLRCKRPFLRLVEDSRRYCYTRCKGGSKKKRPRLDTREESCKHRSGIRHTHTTTGACDFSQPRMSYAEALDFIAKNWEALPKKPRRLDTRSAGLRQASRALQNYVYDWRRKDEDPPVVTQALLTWATAFQRMARTEESRGKRD